MDNISITCRLLSNINYAYRVAKCGCTWYHHPDYQTFTIDPKCRAAKGLVGIRSLKKSI